MKGITLTGERLAGGRTLLAMTEFRLTASLSSPAAALTCKGPVAAFPGELGEVTLTWEGRELFRGRVDKQTLGLDKGGRVLQMEARDKGALLLDNEALPGALTNLRLTTLFGRCIAPYGFSLYAPRFAGSLALYTVHKGVCEWDALTGFTRRVYGRTPYVRGDVVYVDRPQQGQPVVLGTGGHPFTALEWSHIPYNILSKVVLRDADGNYSGGVQNSGAGYYGVKRARYAIPANEFVDAPGLDANQRIRRGMLRKESVTVTCPGLLDIHPGRSAVVEEDWLSLANLLAEEVTLSGGANGLTTTVKLINGIYYD